MVNSMCRREIEVKRGVVALFVDMQQQLQLKSEKRAGMLS